MEIMGAVVRQKESARGQKWEEHRRRDSRGGAERLKHKEEKKVKKKKHKREKRIEGWTGGQ